VLASYAAMSGYFAGNREPPGRNEQPGPKDTKRRLAVAALGRIEPRSEIINIGAGFSPDRLESLLVARGDVVNKGQVLGHLGGYAEQIAQRAMYRAQLEEAKLRLKTEIELNRSRIESAEIHRKEILEVSPLRIAAQKATIESLEAKLANDELGQSADRCAEHRRASVARSCLSCGHRRTRTDRSPKGLFRARCARRSRQDSWIS